MEVLTGNSAALAKVKMQAAKETWNCSFATFCKWRSFHCHVWSPVVFLGKVMPSEFWSPQATVHVDDGYWNHSHSGLEIGLGMGFLAKRLVDLATSHLFDRTENMINMWLQLAVWRYVMPLANMGTEHDITWRNWLKSWLTIPEDVTVPFFLIIGRQWADMPMLSVWYVC